MLTALAAILAFIPIAVGFNINFITLFSELNPHIYFGGDNVIFWKPLSWTIIFGLAFAFFMTLIIVPAMYLIAERLKRPMRNMFGGKWISFLGIPPMIFLFMPLMIVATIRHRMDVNRRRRRLKDDKAGRRNLDQELVLKKKIVIKMPSCWAAFSFGLSAVYRHRHQPRLSVASPAQARRTKLHRAFHSYPAAGEL